jgi:hypothetical protein
MHNEKKFVVGNQSAVTYLFVMPHGQHREIEIMMLISVLLEVICRKCTVCKCSTVEEILKFCLLIQWEPGSSGRIVS